MFDILTLPVGQLETNCYIIFDKETSESLILDPGDDPDYIERCISDKKLQPILIIATHGHFDHLLAVAELKLNYHIPFKIHKNDEFLLNNMESSTKHFLGIDVAPPPTPDGYLKEGDSLKIGSKKLKVIETPGHTPGSICFYQRDEKFLFSGDLLFFQGGVGRTDFSYSDEKLMDKSIEKIFKLSNKIKVYPGHGQPFSLRSWIGISSSFVKQ